jgi:hypothetical protein
MAKMRLFLNLLRQQSDLGNLMRQITWLAGDV